MKIKAYACSVQGSRERNEDAWLVASDRNLFAVADGIGGGVKGDVASRLAVEALKNHASDFSKLRFAFERAQEEVLRQSMDLLGGHYMGTTLTAGILDDDQLELCHVGDSRCYLYSEGCLRQLTEDQESYDEQLGLTVLDSYIGLAPEYGPIKWLQSQVKVKAGDKLLFCTDGLYRQMSEPLMVRILQSDPAGQSVERLCSEAALTESSDNITVVLVEIN